MMSKKSETLFSENHYYIFVALGRDNERASFHIVPSEIVAEYTKNSHANWLTGKKRDGSERKDTSIRKFNDPENTYLEAWYQIKL